MKIIDLDRNNKRIIVTIEEPKNWFKRFFAKNPNRRYRVFAELGCMGTLYSTSICYFPSGDKVDYQRQRMIDNLVSIYTLSSKEDTPPQP